MFNGIWLVASEPVTVRGQEYQTGDRFEVSRTQSGALLVTGRASIAPRVQPAAVPERPAARRRGRPRKTIITNTIDPPASTDVQPDTDDESRRRYRRRDLEAEP